MISHICLVTPPSIFLLDERVFMTLGILKIAAVLEKSGVTVDMLLDLFDFLGYFICLVDEDFCLQPIPRKKLPDVLQIPSVCQNVVLCPAEGIKI